VIRQFKSRYFYWWAGGQKCWESLEGGHRPWKVESHCFKRSDHNLRCLHQSQVHFVSNSIQTYQFLVFTARLTAELSLISNFSSAMTKTAF